MAIYFGQDIATKLTQADAFFASGNHIQSLDWLSYPDAERKAGLLQSEREIDSHLGIALETSYSTTSFPITENSSFRPDYAVFEHALFLLNNTARMRTAAHGAEMIESEEYQKQEVKFGVGISPMAIVYLRLNNIQVERG